MLLEVPEALLEERRRTGAAKLDELWEGVWHFVPTASSAHGALNSDMHLVLGPEAKRQGLRPFADGTGLYRAADDYRVPDQQYVRPEIVSTRGTERGADLVVELRSPNDETYEKLAWYAAMGVREILVVDVATREVELFAGIDGRPVRVAPDADGTVRSRVLGVAFRTVPGPRLAVTTADGTTTEL